MQAVARSASAFVKLKVVRAFAAVFLGMDRELAEKVPRVDARGLDGEGVEGVVNQTRLRPRVGNASAGLPRVRVATG